MNDKRWANIRAAYGAGLNDKQIAKQFRVSTRSIHRHRTADAAVNDPWLRDSGPIPEDTASDKNAPDLSSTSSERESGASDNPPDNPAKKPTITLIAGGKKVVVALKKDEQPDPINPIDFDPRDVTDEAIALGMRAALFHALSEFNAGRIKPTAFQTHADVLASLIASGQKTIASSREVAGKSRGVPSGETSKPLENGITIRHERLETVKIPVDEKGRKVS